MRFGRPLGRTHEYAEMSGLRYGAQRGNHDLDCLSDSSRIRSNTPPLEFFDVCYPTKKAAVAGRTALVRKPHGMRFLLPRRSPAAFAHPCGKLASVAVSTPAPTMSLLPAVLSLLSSASLAQVAPKLRSNLAQKIAVGVFGVGFLMLFVNVSVVCVPGGEGRRGSSRFSSIGSAPASPRG